MSISLKTSKVYGFLKTYLIFASHLCPIVKNRDKVKFYTILRKCKINFNPETYKYVNDEYLVSLFTNIFFIINVKFSKEILLSDILCFSNIQYNGELSYSKELNHEEIIGDGIFKINKELYDDLFFIINSIEIGLNHELLPQVLSNGINPKIVSQFVVCPLVEDIQSLRNTVKDHLTTIDRKNSEINKLKMDYQSLDKQMLFVIKQRDELSKKIQETDEIINELKKEVSQIKEITQARETRKQRLYEVRKRLKLILENPEHKTIDDFYQLQDEYKQLSDDAPCCAITKETLQELKKNDAELRVTKCGHIFDGGTLKAWLKMPSSNNKCPTCKSDVKMSETYQVFI